MSDQRRILNLLLDAYERSAHYGSGNSSRSVFIRLDRQHFPEYWDDGSPDHRAALHLVLAELESAGVVTVAWARHAAGVELDRATLRLERLTDAYALARRTPRAANEARLRGVAEAHRARLPDWGVAFVDALIGAIDQVRPLPAGFKPADHDVVADVLTAAGALDADQPLPRRVFSLQTFGTTKHFEQAVERPLLRILRRFHEAASDAEDDANLLAEVGVTANPDHVYLAGPLRVVYQGREVDLSAFFPDVGLPVEMARESMIAALPAARVLTVENLTTFHLLAAQRPYDVLLVYLGGYHNRVRRTFIRRLWEAAPSAQFRHWGDIDLGGLRIFQLLKEGSGAPLRPLRMDLATYNRYAHLGAPMAAVYLSKVQQAVRRPAYAEFAPLINLMARRKVRIEQEAMPVAGTFDEDWY